VTTKTRVEADWEAFKLRIEPELASKRPYEWADGTTACQFVEPQKKRAYGRSLGPRGARRRKGL